MQGLWGQSLELLEQLEPEPLEPESLELLEQLEPES